MLSMMVIIAIISLLLSLSSLWLSPVLLRRKIPNSAKFEPVSFQWCYTSLLYGEIIPLQLLLELKESTELQLE